MPTTDERPWMALDESLARPARPADIGEREESTGAEVFPLRRRSFLTLAGISASLAACERLPVRDAMPYLVAPEEITPGVSTYYATTCQACPAGCGMVATVRDGRPIKLEGHPDHPLSAGGLCAFGQGDLRGLYDAGRLHEPTVGGRSATWAEVDREVRDQLARLQTDGRSLWVLSRSLVSPSMRAAVELLLSRWGGSRWVEWDPEPDPGTAVLEAAGLLYGRPLAPHLEIGAADLLVTLGTDLLGAGPDPVVHTAAWSARRRAPGRPPLRHVHVEANLSLTGANADERWSATAAERRTLALALLRRISAATSGGEALAGLEVPAAVPHAERVDRLATELLAARGHSLVVAATDDVAEALAVGWINRLLGNEGRTLDPERPSLTRRGLASEVAAFRAALAAGEVGGVLALGLDPVGQWPDGDALGAALAKLPLTIAVGDRPTATATACKVVAAAHHPLECWADAQPRPDVLTLAQPAIRPLFGTRAPLSSVLAWAEAPETDDRLFVKQRWQRDVLPASGDAEAAWRAAVRQGIAPPGSRVAPLPPPTKADTLAALRAPAAAMPGGTALEVELLAEVAVRDGSRIHVPWLRELPDPLTRVAWLPCARLAPATAASLGIHDGDVVAVRVGDRSVELPARVLPGQHPRVVGLPVGYGLAEAGDAPTANAARVASFDEQGHVRTRSLPARVEATGRRERLPLVQVHASSEGRPIVFQVASAAEVVHGAHVPAGRDLWPDREKTVPQWHMVIDLDSCTGCSACVVACQAENNIAVVGPVEVARNRGMHWLRIDRYFAGSPEEPDVLFEPMMCSQCHHAPCETVCPVAATVHSEDGLNQQVYNRCVGTRYCANNCPYKVRAFNWFDNQPDEPVARMVLNPDVTVRARGVMEKCTFCVQRIQTGRIAARAAGDAAVPAVQTACQQSCPARAIHFGDGEAPAIAEQRHQPRAFQALADLGVAPRITYLSRVRTRGGGAPTSHDTHGGHS